MKPDKIADLFLGSFSIKRKTVLFFALAVVFAGCLGPKKINKWVAEQYGEVPTAVKKKSDLILITTSLPTMGTTLSTDESHTSGFLPLIFYWQCDYKNIVTLNPQIAINSFTATVLSYANKGLKQKLNDRRVELSIDSLPTEFAIDDKSHLIWLIYAYSWDKFTVQPDKKNMVISYKVFSADNTVTKSGTISVTNSDRALTLQMFQSLKKKTWQYFDQYDANIAAMSKSFVDKLKGQL